MKRARNIWTLAAVVTVFCVGACNDGGSIGQPGTCDLTYDLLAYLRVDGVTHLSPVVGGTRLDIRGESFIAESTCVNPRVALVGGLGELELPAEILSPNDIHAEVPGNIAAVLGTGLWSGSLVVQFAPEGGGTTYRASLPVSFEIAPGLTPDPTRLGQVEAYLNDDVTIEGRGFLDGVGEGATEVVIDGNFEVDGAGTTPVSGLVLPTELLTTTDRGRVTFRWSPRIGGLRPGVFRGTVTVRNNHHDGAMTTAPPLEISMVQQQTVMFSVAPDEPSLGQIATLSGRGFVGSTADDPAEGITSFRLVGQFLPCDGVPIRCTSTPVDVDVEIVGDFVSGAAVDYAVTVSNTGGRLHAVDFGYPRGTFEGSVTPILTLGTDRYEGLSLPLVTIVLGPIRQVAWVRFIPGFSTSLDLFGLGAMEAVIRSRIITRMEEIYCPPTEPRNCINVEFRTEEPQDFYPGGYAIIDIGGPDPNALGLFGYDNTPGKDIGNLRLWDHVGGENATGALDGYGYGGVFVESMLFWSEHPPPEVGERGSGSPPPDPRFDAIFDLVRGANEVVAGEYPSGPDPARVAEIEAAISFIANMVADTAAHEFGHSLGLAQPFVPDEAFHNAFPQEGCLMDSGSERPIEERALLDGNPGARFCQENLWYLQDILPIE